MEAHPCLMRFLTNLARLCASKSANGPRKNSFRPDSPSRHPPTGDGTLSHPPHHTGHGPFRPLIVSNLKWGEPCRGHYVFPAGRYQILHIFYKRGIEGISYFPHTVALSGLDKVRPRT